MTKKSVNRSPLFYVGDKYKLISEIKTHFPTHIRQFIEPFVGGGSVFLNVDADIYSLNDIDKEVIGLHQFLCEESARPDQFFKDMFGLIDEYGLSCSYLRDEVPEELKQAYKKTYFAKYNREGFGRLKADFNAAHRDDKLWLYVLLIYGFNRMLRFNRRGEYNLPVGNVDFNKNASDALNIYFEQVKHKAIRWSNLDFTQFLLGLDYEEDDLVYLDPPYLITFSEYNKLWNEETERALLRLLDELSYRNIKFAISNVTHYKGRVNEQFLTWGAKYHVHPIKSNYISYHDNTIKQFNEVLVTNY